MVKSKVGSLTDLLCRLFPSLTVEDAGEFLHVQFVLVCGLYSMANLTEKQLKAMEVAGLLHTRVDFDSHFQRAESYLIRGFVG